MLILMLINKNIYNYLIIVFILCFFRKIEIDLMFCKEFKVYVDEDI